jgi:hypothetical protein
MERGFARRKAKLEARDAHRAAPLSFALAISLTLGRQAVDKGEQPIDVIWTELELRHRGVTRDDTLRQRLGQMIDGIPQRQQPEGWCEFQRALSGRPNGMAPRTEPLGNGLTTPKERRLRA